MREASNTEANRDPEVRAIVEQTMTSFTLAVRARTGAPAVVLDALIDATVDVICARRD